MYVALFMAISVYTNMQLGITLIEWLRLSLTLIRLILIASNSK